MLVLCVVITKYVSLKFDIGQIPGNRARNNFDEGFNSIYLVYYL